MAIGNGWSSLDRRLRILIFGLGLFVAVAVIAYVFDSRPTMTRAAILDALTGMTIEGSRDGTDYRQYFDADGSTVYLELDMEIPMVGRWQATDDGNVCTTMPDDPIKLCYGIWVEGDAVMWLEPGTGRAYPARRLAGQRIDE